MVTNIFADRPDPRRWTPASVLKLAGFISCVGIGAFALDRHANRTTATVTVTAKQRLPQAIGDKPALMIRVTGLQKPGNGWLTMSSGWFGATRDGDFDRFDAIRVGCRYKNGDP
jgi:hypothetical protein